MPVEVMEREVAAAFDKFGDFSLKVTFDKRAIYESARIAFVNFYSHEDAREALQQRHETKLCNREMYIEPVLRQFTNVHCLGVASSYFNGRRRESAKVDERPPPPPPRADKARGRPRLAAIYSFENRHYSLTILKSCNSISFLVLLWDLVDLYDTINKCQTVSLS
jgi:RNA recognition motif-containing protein